MLGDLFLMGLGVYPDPLDRHDKIIWQVRGAFTDGASSLRVPWPSARRSPPTAPAARFRECPCNGQSLSDRHIEMCEQTLGRPPTPAELPMSVDCEAVIEIEAKPLYPSMVTGRQL